MYAAFCRNGNQNVYLFEMHNSDGYVNHFVNFDVQTKRNILAILGKYTVIKDADSLHDILDHDLEQFQPEVKSEWLDHFDNILRKEKRMLHVDMFIKAAMVSLLAYAFYKKWMMNLNVIESIISLF